MYQEELNCRRTSSSSSGSDDSVFTMAAVMFEGLDEVASISPLTFLYSISEIGVDFGGVFY